MEVPFASSDLATLLPTAFWLLLLLPGVALARRLAPRDLESPPIVGVAVAYVVLLACLAPLVVGACVHLCMCGHLAAHPTSRHSLPRSLQRRPCTLWSVAPRRCWIRG